jgi:hypothetical protein
MRGTGGGDGQRPSDGAVVGWERCDRLKLAVAEVRPELRVADDHQLEDLSSLASTWGGRLHDEIASDLVTADWMIVQAKRPPLA